MHSYFAALKRNKSVIDDSSPSNFNTTITKDSRDVNCNPDHDKHESTTDKNEGTHFSDNLNDHSDVNCNPDHDMYENTTDKNERPYFSDNLNDPSIALNSSDAHQGEKTENHSITVNDISNYIGKELNNSQKIEVIKSLWVPPLNFNFPVENAKTFKRHFQRKWLNEYRWLSFSKEDNGLYCSTCVIFLNKKEVGKGAHQTPKSFVTKPFYNLKKAIESFKNHQETEYHKNAVLIKSNITTVAEKRTETIDKQLDIKRKKDAEENRLKLNVIVDTIRLCGVQNIALRGHNDWGRVSISAPNKNDGNFRSLLRYRIDGGDLILRKHVESCSANAMYTSPRIQNALIESFSHLIQKAIIEQVKESQYFTILADETTDISQIEQFSLCIRHITNSKPFIIREDFLAFVPVFDVTGEGLATIIEEKLNKFGLDLTNLRGQGYDGASSMRGQFKGVQALLRKKYPKALYTHCLSHSLNLCLSDAFKVLHVRNAVCVITETCTFFRASAKRTNILEKKLKEYDCNARRIKTLCETRWCDRHEAVILFKDSILPIVAALEEINELPGDHCKRASLILNTICTSTFIISLIVISKLLGFTYNLSKYLQKENLDLFNALGQIKATKGVLEDLRNNTDSEFRKVFDSVEKLATELNVEITIRRLTGLQKNRPNPPISDPEAYYRVSIFIPCIDDMISSLNERFLDQEESVSSLQYAVPKYSDVPFNKIEPAFEFYKTDLNNYVDVCQGEWELWRKKWEKVEIKPSNAVDGLNQCDKDVFPNIHLLLKFLALLPVSTASVERTFSKLKLIKTYLRNTNSESRLNGLAMMFINREIALKITNDDVINHFANSGSARRLQL